MRLPASVSSWSGGWLGWCSFSSRVLWLSWYVFSILAPGIVWSSSWTIAAVSKLVIWVFKFGVCAPWCVDVGVFCGLSVLFLEFCGWVCE